MALRQTIGVIGKFRKGYYVSINSYRSLSPASFLERSAVVFADRTAIIDGDRRFTYREFGERAKQLTGVLAARGIGPGDRVAALCTNSHVMLELHHAVPMRSAVMVALNIRLTETELRQILQHSGAKLLVATHEFADVARRLADDLNIGLMIASEGGGDYDAELMASSDASIGITDERSLLAINYTSGTTGTPKGVMYHHRGAYLQALAMAFHTELGPSSSYLWTLPMFHCNGWCYTWGVTAAGATHVCLRAVDPGEIWRRLRQGVTHFSAAPTVLTMIAEDDGASTGPLETRVKVATGGAPPTPTLLRRLSALNMDITHLYGLTESFGPVMINQWQPAWDSLDADEAALKQARQGVQNVIGNPPRVVDGNGVDVPADGDTIGELLLSGNDVMLGYYRDDAASEAAELDGWFRTGDLAVMHPDHYVELRDRLKDVIISGGENIASVEIERALDSHPAVLECAVVGEHHDKWGEVPVAFVTLRSGHDVDPEELIAHVKQSLASFKVPHRFEFVDALPKTSTGKIQKNNLRGKVAGGPNQDVR